MHRKEDIRDIRKCPQDEVKSGWSVSVDANRALLTIGNTVPQLTFSTIFVNSTSKEPRLPEPTNNVYYNTADLQHHIIIIIIIIMSLLQCM